MTEKAHKLLEGSSREKFSPKYGRSTTHLSGNRYSESIEIQLPSARVYVLAHYLVDPALKEIAFDQLTDRASHLAVDLSWTLGSTDDLYSVCDSVAKDRTYNQQVWFAAIRAMRAPDILKKIVPKEFSFKGFYFSALDTEEKEWVCKVLGINMSIDIESCI